MEKAVEAIQSGSFQGFGRKRGASQGKDSADKNSEVKRNISIEEFSVVSDF